MKAFEATIVNGFLGEHRTEHRSRGLGSDAAKHKAVPERVRQATNFASQVEAKERQACKKFSFHAASRLVTMKDSEDKRNLELQGLKRSRDEFWDNKSMRRSIWKSMPDDHPEKVKFNQLS